MVSTDKNTPWFVDATVKVEISNPSGLCRFRQGRWSAVFIEQLPILAMVEGGRGSKLDLPFCHQ